MKDIILLHGALASKDQFNPLIPLLKFDRIHTFNFPGHGDAFTAGSLSMNDLSHSLDQFITQHQIDQPVVFGYSMGGYAALKAAVGKDHIAKIMTLGTKLDWSESSLSGMLKMFNPEAIEAKVPQLAQSLSRTHGRDHWKMVVRQTAEMLQALSEKDQIRPEEFENITIPVALYAGDQDQTVSMEETKLVAELIPNAQYHEMPKTPHPFEKVDLPMLAALINNYLGD